MRLRPRTVLLVTFVAALVVFAAVQDRVTATGAHDYVVAQRAALAGRSSSVTIDQVVAPVVRQSVADGFLWALAVMAAGVAVSRFLVPGSGFRK